MPSYQGTKVVGTIYQYNLKTGFPTGVIKPNVPEDPDYVAPDPASDFCPVILTEWVGADPVCQTNHIFENVYLSQNFTKQACPVNYHGSVETYSVAAGTYFSALSQEAADQQALDDIAANGQTYANTNGTCIEDEFWLNTQQSQSFAKSGCPVNYHGSDVVYTVAAGGYKSYVSQTDANNMALAEITANGQSNANSLGTCIEDDNWFNVYQSQSFEKSGCPVNYHGSSVVYEVVANTYKSYVSQVDANNMALAEIATNGQANADANGTCIEDANWLNTYQSQSFQKQGCPANFYGSTVVYGVIANTYKSYVSQADADNMALADIAANGQTYANTNGTCIEEGSFVNAYQAQSFTKDNCPANFSGSAVIMSVAAGTYTSYVSQADADNQALAYIAANGQANANTNGTCVENANWLNTAQSGNFTKSDCGPESTGSVVTYTVAANTYKSYISQTDANNMAIADVNANGQAYANANGSCIPNPVPVTVNYSLSKDTDPHVDLVLVPLRNGTNLGNVYPTSTGVFAGTMSGDSIYAGIVHQTAYQPWPLLGRARMTIKKDGIDIFASGWITNNAIDDLSNHTFVLEAGSVYDVIAESESASTDYISGVVSLFNNSSAPLSVSTPLPVGFTLIDHTDEGYIFNSGQYTNPQQNMGINWFNDAALGKLLIVNNSVYDLEFTLSNFDFGGGYSQTMIVLANGGSNTLDNIPKTSYKITYVDASFL